MGDEANDYGTFVVTSLLTDEEADQALAYYLEHEPTLEEQEHFYAFVVFAAWCWYNWALYKEALDECVGDWRSIYRHCATHYLDRLLQLMGYLAYEIRFIQWYFLGLRYSVVGYRIEFGLAG